MLTEDRHMETTRNPVALITAIVGALAGLLTTLVTWALTAIPAAVPTEVTTALGLLLYALVAFASWSIGRWAQSFTTPVSDPRGVDSVPLVSETRLLEVEGTVQEGGSDDPRG